MNEIENNELGFKDSGERLELENIMVGIEHVKEIAEQIRSAMEGESIATASSEKIKKVLETVIAEEREILGILFEKKHRKQATQAQETKTEQRCGELNEENKEVQETVVIGWKEYDINTTTEIEIKGEVALDKILKLRNLTHLRANSATKIPPELAELANLTHLHANSAKEIPSTLINLTHLHANSAKEIPSTLTNLTVLRANSAKEIPSTLTKLIELRANSAKEIPSTLTNLTVLYANSAKEIPSTLTNLTVLYANSAMQIPYKLTELVVLHANSAIKIPTSLKKLIELKTRAIFDVIDFPKLECYYGMDI